MRPAWSAALARAKHDLGIEIVGPDASPARLVRALRQGAVVALLVDGDVATARATAVIGDREAQLPLGPARLAALTGAALVAGRCERDFAAARVAYRVRLTPLPEPTFTAVARWLESTLADNAEAWCLFRPFFTTPIPTSSPTPNAE